MINKKKESLKDTLFQKKTSPITPFQFNEKTTSVFNDMINRSIPLYKEILQMISDLAALNFRPKVLLSPSSSQPPIETNILEKSAGTTTSLKTRSR